MNIYMNEEKLNHLVKISQSCEEGMLNEIIDQFSVETLKYISEIKAAVAEKNILQIHTSTKALRTSADYIGAKKLSKISGELERATGEGYIPRNLSLIHI